MKEFLFSIQSTIGAVSGRAFVDSAPVLDKAWAAKSGLGWIGKNSNLLTQKVGSFYFIAELIIDLDLDYDNSTTDHCGTCTACVNACPTEAIVAPYVVDGSKCISYFTIELKENIPHEMKNKFDDWAFGCDVCQDVCPWNRFAPEETLPEFQQKLSFSAVECRALLRMTDEEFLERFQGTPLSRSGRIASSRSAPARRALP